MLNEADISGFMDMKYLLRYFVDCHTQLIVTFP